MGLLFLQKLLAWRPSRGYRRQRVGGSLPDADFRPPMLLSFPARGRTLEEVENELCTVRQQLRLKTLEARLEAEIKRLRSLEMGREDYGLSLAPLGDPRPPEVTQGARVGIVVKDPSGTLVAAAFWSKSRPLIWKLIGRLVPTGGVAEALPTHHSSTPRMKH